MTKKEEYEKVFRESYSNVFNQCYRVLRNKEESEDVTQVTFLKAYRKWNQYKGRAKRGTWIYSIARNEILMTLRKKKQPMNNLIDNRHIDEIRETEFRESPYLMQDPIDKKIIGSNIDQTDRQIISLLYQGFRTTEMPILLDMTLPAIKSRINRIRIKIRKKLNIKHTPNQSKANSARAKILYITQNKNMNESKSEKIKNRIDQLSKRLYGMTKLREVRKARSEINSLKRELSLIDPYYKRVVNG